MPTFDRESRSSHENQNSLGVSWWTTASLLVVAALLGIAALMEPNNLPDQQQTDRPAVPAPVR